MKSWVLGIEAGSWVLYASTEDLQLNNVGLGCREASARSTLPNT